MCNKLILTWKNSKDAIWIPVGILEYRDNQYYFKYTDNIKKVKNFIPFGKMSDLNKTYVSEELFPIFKNRLLSKSRPEYEDFLRWLDIDKSLNHELLELSISRGIRATDELQLYPIPQKNEVGQYEVLFFAHGVSHINKTHFERLHQLKPNDKLLLLKDVQNEIDPHALVLRTRDKPIELLGYCPSFFAQDFSKLMKLNGSKNVHVFVKKLNIDAPLQFKLLCKLTTKWPEKFQVFDHENFV
jgi:hypothetical protein